MNGNKFDLIAKKLGGKEVNKEHERQTELTMVMKSNENTHNMKEINGNDNTTFSNQQRQLSGEYSTISANFNEEFWNLIPKI